MVFARGCRRFSWPGISATGTVSRQYGEPRGRSCHGLSENVRIDNGTIPVVGKSGRKTLPHTPVPRRRFERCTVFILSIQGVKNTRNDNVRYRAGLLPCGFLRRGYLSRVAFLGLGHGVREVRSVFANPRVVDFHLRRVFS